MAIFGFFFVRFTPPRLSEGEHGRYATSPTEPTMKPLSRTLLLSASAAVLATSIAAQSPNAKWMLYTVNNREFTVSGSGGLPMRVITPMDIALTEQSAPCQHSAEKWAPNSGYNTLLGDENGDGSHWNGAPFGSIDAVFCKYKPSWTGRVNMRNAYFSPSNYVGPVVSGGPGFRPGDCGAIVRNGGGDGQVEFFLRTEHIMKSFGIVTPQINLDAITQDQNRNIYISLENDQKVQVYVGSALTWMLMRDGAIGMIPASTITYDSWGNVTGVLPNRGIILLSENDVTQMTVNARLSDRVGNCLQPCVDTDALSIDPNGGMNKMLWGTTSIPYPNLAIACESYTGGGAITTRSMGQILTIDGCKVGTPCGSGPTYGPQIGLKPMSSTGGIWSHINGLHIVHRSPCRFTLDTATPVTTSPSTIKVDVGSPPGSTPYLLLGFGASGAGTVSSSAPWLFGSNCFPDLYPVIFGLGAIPTGPQGFGSLTFTGVPTGSFLFQSVFIATTGAIELSNPVTLIVN